MRLAWYAGASTALAAAVVASAFHQRANFYSAMVHLSQSNISIMILVNLILLVYTSFVYGLQRLCFGQLRPVEVEQLYDKGWIAVTETCLAMTIFKDDLGAFSMVMFTALLTGKVWGWIGEGRVEILEQQPPANPRLFHARLIVSLTLSIFYNFWMLLFAIRTVIRDAKPNMMVMFLFEFGILLVSSIQTGLRYVLSLYEQRVIKIQTRQGLEARRRQIREQRADMLRRRESGEATEAENDEPLPEEDDVEEMDIEVPGWEAKGHWILLLDLGADFVKLALYSVFFMVLFTFVQLPLHIMRDLFMTTRSFIKRLGALLRYRQAIKDLSRYPDATEEDLARENTCIICREEMHVWDPNGTTQVERSRPKKLPCGHILHFGCLKSWLERQQVCPTCRRSVVIGGPEADRNNRDAVVIRVGGAVPNENGAAPAAPAAPAGAPNNQQGQQPPQPRPNVRMFNLGPIRLGFAQGDPQDFQDMAQMMGVAPDAANNLPTPQNPEPPAPSQPGLAAGPGRSSSVDAIYAQLRAIEERIQSETLSLRFAEQEAQVLRLLLQQIEMIRLGQAQNIAAQAQAVQQGPSSQPQGQAAQPPGSGSLPAPHTAQQGSQPPPSGPSSSSPTPQNLSRVFQRMNAPPPVTRHVAAPNATGIPAGSPDLPAGVTIPPGWSLLPLQRADTRTGHIPVPPPTAQPSGPEQSQAQAQAASRDRAPPASAARETVPTATSPGGEAARAPSTGVASGSESEEGDDEQAGSAGEESAAPQQQAAPPAAEPNSSSSAPPVWGGSAQLFGSSRPVADSSGSSAGEGASATQNGNTPKGKAKAVSVEEAEDEEDEEEEDDD